MDPRIEPAGDGSGERLALIENRSSGLGPGHSEFSALRANGRPDIRLALRPARSSDGDALQT